ncbi:MAG: histidine kinase [Niastella sp.]|nr:histidine kinase [Niastella sp.]
MSRVKTPAVVTHITGWLIFLSLPVLFMAGQAGKDRAFDTLFSPWYWLLFGSYSIVFYLHTYFLFPKLYLGKRIIAYISIISLLLAGVYLLRPFDRLFTQVSHFDRGMMDEGRPRPQFEEMRPPAPDFDARPPMPRREPRGQHFDIVSIFLFFLTLSLSIALQTTWRWRSTEKRALQAEAEKAQAELAFLKAQINPHFLFNTLNNIYSLAITHSEHTADSIMKLSNILRYVTDEVNQDYVALQQEIDCIQDYIDLQQLRLGKKTTVSFTISGNPAPLSIAPLILMTFVENAFKYGVSNHQASSIIIDLQAHTRSIVFSCSNALFPRKQDERTGIGIANTQQRLEHLYPHKHYLNITTDNNLYSVSLALDI